MSVSLANHEEFNKYNVSLANDESKRDDSSLNRHLSLDDRAVEKIAAEVLSNDTSQERKNEIFAQHISLSWQLYKTIECLQGNVEDLEDVNKIQAAQLKETRRALLQTKANKKIELYKKNIASIKKAKTSTKVLTGCGAVTGSVLLFTPAALAGVGVLVGSIALGGGIAASVHSGTKNMLQKKETQIWVLENFPESIESEEIKKEAESIYAEYVKKVEESMDRNTHDTQEGDDCGAPELDKMTFENECRTYTNELQKKTNSLKEKVNRTFYI